MEDHEIKNNEKSLESLNEKFRCQIKLNKMIKQEIFKIMGKLYHVDSHIILFLDDFYLFTHHGHPSLSRDYGFELWMVVLVLIQHQVWLARPIPERHCFPHWVQV